MKNIIPKNVKDNIDDLCRKYEIENYKINHDGSIDVDDDVDITYKKLTAIPLKFHKVSGDFLCHLNLLTSLKGCPVYVGGSFVCAQNKLTSLEYCPTEVGDNFNCSNNQLITLEYCPKQIPGHFTCGENRLNTLEYSPKYIGNGFYCSWNKLTSLSGCPDTVINNFECSNNDSLNSLSELTTSVGGKLEFLHTNLPTTVLSFINKANPIEIETFLKYQNHFDIWIPEFNEENFNDLIAEIKEGLL